MRTITACCAVVAAALTLGSIPAVAAGNLGDVLREAGWDRIIGTWTGANPKGSQIRITYAWRFKDRVLEITTRNGEKETVSLVARNPKTGKVFNASADNQGGSSIGEWKLEDGQTILDLAFVIGDGQEGTLRIRHKLENNDALTVTIDAPEPVTLKMTRVKSQDSKGPDQPDAGGGK